MSFPEHTIRLTLSIEEVLNRNVMRTLVQINGSVLEDILRGAGATQELLGILVAQSIHLVRDGRSLKLL